MRSGGTRQRDFDLVPLSVEAYRSRREGMGVMTKLYAWIVGDSDLARVNLTIVGSLTLLVCVGLIGASI